MKLDKKTIAYIKKEVRKWTDTSNQVAYATPYAGLIDGELFIKALEGMEVAIDLEIGAKQKVTKPKGVYVPRI